MGLGYQSVNCPHITGSMLKPGYGSGTGSKDLVFLLIGVAGGVGTNGFGLAGIML